MKDLQPLKRRNCKTPKCHYTVPKSQIGTLEVLDVLDLIKKNPSVKQAELVEQTGKSVRSIKRIIDSLKPKQYIRRVDGKWKILI
ncbi:winged helix-turn-helix transcriptional regulator [Neglectibacter sp. CSJ-5]|uniref:winged helix-turn-helix transcriptional regulator n=1 Tax=Neglectibacter sp. CSJ-5 TaxID=3078043 RepID=UPI00292F759A|nr:winged helix-turn-helix transcriptional regulator [Neglectibacter sp. CSJ-5]